MSIISHIYFILLFLFKILLYTAILGPILYFIIKKAIVDAHNEINSKL